MLFIGYAIRQWRGGGEIPLSMYGLVGLVVGNIFGPKIRNGLNGGNGKKGDGEGQKS